LAKHKKKKSPPTPDPEDSKKKENVEEENQDIPPTEKVDASKKDDPPKTEDTRTEEQKDETTRKLDKLFWFRIALAVIGGTAATFMFDSIEGEERRWASIGFMIMIFIASIVMAKSMNLRLPKSDRKKIVTQALGSYVFLYLFTWILSYTLVNANNSETITSIPFP
jgi:multidrug transporter EmrE-like cation transporter